MSDRAAAEAWFTAYREAWESNDEDSIRALFTEDAVYKGSPANSSTQVGADAIARWWVDGENRDEPGDTDFEWRLLAVDGEVAIAQCVTTYVTETPPLVYDNLFVIRLAPDGRATEFTDWWIQRKGTA
jgi:ketosteroid isomerase-like protein